MYSEVLRVKLDLKNLSGFQKKNSRTKANDTKKKNMKTSKSCFVSFNAKKRQKIDNQKVFSFI